MKPDFQLICKSDSAYNFHSHTQFCDGKADMLTMAESALKEGLRHYGFTPHGPLPPGIPSECNMSVSAMKAYLKEFERVEPRFLFDDIQLYKGIEADWISRDWGPHVDLIQNAGLDYIIGSVHFVPTQDGRMVDCDGPPERFKKYLKEFYCSDLRYVVEKFYEQTLLMLEQGGFDILGHLDKIGRNASAVDTQIEDNSWYQALIDDVICYAKSAGIAIEINTKASADNGRFFPSERYWPRLVEEGMVLVVNSDAHRPEGISLGRQAALEKLGLLDASHRSLKKERPNL